jgi:large subunit ribosomal protein L22
MGPRKLRLIVDVIRGRDVTRAQNALSIMNKKGAKPVLKLLRSAIANAKNNFQLDTEKLRIASVTVDGGPMIKRWLPRAHGRATPIRERTSHVILTLEPFTPKVKKAKATK